jgi:hypothetical protein
MCCYSSRALDRRFRESDLSKKLQNRLDSFVKLLMRQHDGVKGSRLAVREKIRVWGTLPKPYH